MLFDTETKPEPVQFALTLRPELGKQEPIFRVYEPIDLMLDGKRLAYQIRGIDRALFPDKVTGVMRERAPTPVSYRKVPVIGDTLKLDRLLNWYAPLHNLPKDHALAKCVTNVQYGLWQWRRPRYLQTPTVPLSEFRLELLSVEVLEFPKGV